MASISKWRCAIDQRHTYVEGKKIFTKAINMKYALPAGKWYLLPIRSRGYEIHYFDTIKQLIVNIYKVGCKYCKQPLGGVHDIPYHIEVRFTDTFSRQTARVIRLHD